MSALLQQYRTLAELSRSSGLSRRTLQRHLAAAEGGLPYYKVGGRVLVRQDEFDGWMEARRGCSEAGRLRDVALGQRT